MAQRVLISDKLPDICQTVLRDNGIQVDYEPEISPEDLVKAIPKYAALGVRSRTKATAEVIAAGDNLKVIGRAGAGVDNIDLKAADAKGIVVVNTPDANSISVNEYVFAVMLSHYRQLAEYDASMKQDKWEKGNFPVNELYEKTIGIVGMGGIGSEVAKRAKAFGMNVIFHDPYVESYEGREQASLKDVFKRADFVSLHVPKADGTKDMITPQLLKSMKKGGVFINTSRAGVIMGGEATLDKLLGSREDLRFALDVHDVEKAKVKIGGGKIKIERVLKKYGSRVILTPHTGPSKEANARAAEGIANEFVSFLKSGTYRSAVNAPIMPEESIPSLALAERIAYLGASLLGKQPTAIKASCYGGLKEYAPFILNSAVRGSLAVNTDQYVSQVNAKALAEKKGIKLEDREVDDSKDYGPQITLDLVARGKGERMISIRGGKPNKESQPVIFRINDYTGKPSQFETNHFQGIGMSPEGNNSIYVCKHSSGIVGVVGTVYGRAGINITGMHTAKSSDGKKELLVLQTEKPVSQAVLSRVERGLNGKKIKVYDAKAVNF
ncbi:NAD(P)-dependent oxidoreductase [Nanoarchaeota archaeon]